MSVSNSERLTHLHTIILRFYISSHGLLLSFPLSSSNASSPLFFLLENEDFIGAALHHYHSNS